MDKIIASILGALVLFILTGSLIFLLKSERFSDPRKRLFFKTLCSLMFWFFGWITFLYSGSGIMPFAAFMILGFTLSVIGDILLAFDGDQCFILGLLMFFLAQISYCTSFIMRYGFNNRSLIFFAIIAAIAFVIFNFTHLFAFGKMRILANLYLLVLSFMQANGLNGLVSAREGLTTGLLTALGALLFFMSDSVLAYEKFSKKGGLRLEKPVLITYYSAQILLALGMMTFVL